MQELIRLGGSHGHEHFMMSTGHRMDRVAYDTEVLKVVLDRMTTEPVSTCFSMRRSSRLGPIGARCGKSRS